MITKTDKSGFESYLVDAANIKGDCESVLIPETEEELISIVIKANSEKNRITIAASRTGLNGGSVPDDGILVSLEKLNEIISIDEKNKSAVVQPGVILSDFQSEVEKLGLFYPPDPTETNCSMGGTVANNSSGARTFKYGATRNFVLSIDVILPTGEKVIIKRGENFLNNLEGRIKLGESQILKFNIPDYTMPNVKHAAGYYCKQNMDLIDLFIGSEGTLGIISQIEFKLINLPSNVLSMIIFFNDEENIFSFVDDVRKRSYSKTDTLKLREIEFFDENTLKLLIDEYSNIPSNTKGAVWIEQEFENEEEDKLLEEIEKIIDRHNGDVENIWFALNENERSRLKEFRHKIPLKVNDIISGRGLVKIGTDTAVPDDKFREFYSFTINLIKQNNLDYVVYGHIGNSHLHFNMLPKDENELKLGRSLYGKICDKSVELGGTISAEHGIGKLKRNYLLKMFGAENIKKMASLKLKFDPNKILNIGNIFDEKYLEMD